MQMVHSCLYTCVFSLIGIRLSCIIPLTFLHVFPACTLQSCVISLSKSPLSCCQLPRYLKAVVCFSCCPSTIISSLDTGCPLETSSTPSSSCSSSYHVLPVCCPASLLLVVIPPSFWAPDVNIIPLSSLIILQAMLQCKIMLLVSEKVELYPQAAQKCVVFVSWKSFESSRVKIRVYFVMTRLARFFTEMYYNVY